MLKKVQLKIVSERWEPQNAAKTPERAELLKNARYRDDGVRVTISYEEDDSSGMAGSTTTLSFAKSEPGRISLSRTGTVRTALVFESGKCHTSVYQTPIMPFDLCITCQTVQNAIESNGELLLDYTSELGGSEAEHTRFHMTVLT